MSTEFINAIYVRPQGVFLYSRSSNDSLPYREWKCDSLTEVYKSEGQRGLDREIVRMLCEYAEIRGSHPSMARYRPCLREGLTLRDAFEQSLRQAHQKMTPEDIASIWLPDDKRTAGAKEYHAFRCEAESRLYTKLAELAAALPAKPLPTRSGGAR